MVEFRSEFKYKKFVFLFLIPVPRYIILEHVRGGNLSDYLKEEFCPHKIHLYDNVKKKSFQVAEKGNFQILPVFALQVARGLRFLLNNKVGYNYHFLSLK